MKRTAMPYPRIRRGATVYDVNTKRLLGTYLSRQGNTASIVTAAGLVRKLRRDLITDQ